MRTADRSVRGAHPVSGGRSSSSAGIAWIDALLERRPSSLVVPSLTTGRQPFAEMGAVAGEVVLELADGKAVRQRSMSSTPH